LAVLKSNFNYALKFVKILILLQRKSTKNNGFFYLSEY